MQNASTTRRTSPWCICRKRVNTVISSTANWLVHPSASTCSVSSESPSGSLSPCNRSLPSPAPSNGRVIQRSCYPATAACHPLLQFIRDMRHYRILIIEAESSPYLTGRAQDKAKIQIPVLTPDLTRVRSGQIAIRASAGTGSKIVSTGICMGISIRITNKYHPCRACPRHAHAALPCSRFESPSDLSCPHPGPCCRSAPA